MVDTPTKAVAVASATPKKSPKAKKEKKAAVKPAHPATNVMVLAAVKELKERNGCSLQAIKKYISTTYKVDADKMASYIRKALKNAVTSGAIVQTKGTGASGRFKMPGPVKTEKAKKPAAKPKVAKPKTAAAAAKPAAAKKATDAKKVAKPKKSPAKKPAAKPKSPSKAKKTSKVPTEKPKSPKAKTAKKAVKSPKKK